MWWRFLLVPVVALVVVGVEFGLYYRGRYTPPPLPRPPVERIVLPDYTIPEEPARVSAVRKGVALIDTAHANDYDPQEAEVLLARLASQGYRLEFLGNPDPRRGFLSAEERVKALEEKLRFVDTFITLVPSIPFTAEEVDLLKRFVRKGGKVLLVGDPTRGDHAINSLASAFGFTFGPDYLYNVREHESNFQNVFFTQFTPDPITLGLQRITFFLSSPVTGGGTPLVVADANTFSSMRERYEPLSPLVKDRTGRVLAVGDLTFLGAPFNAITDNDRLISNIVEFLTTSTRTFELADFPHIFRADVDIVLLTPQALPAATRLRQGLTRAEREVRLREGEDFGRDTIFLGLWGEAGRVVHYLAAANVTVEEVVRTPVAPPLEREGSGLLLLARQGARYVLVGLAGSPKALEALADRLLSGQFRDGLVNDVLGLYADLER